jgi:hypothetical protein
VEFRAKQWRGKEKGTLHGCTAYATKFGSGVDHRGLAESWNCRAGRPSSCKKRGANGHRLLRELAKCGVQTDSLWSTPVAVGHVWQRRFYDLVVFTDRKRVEKLRYMHCNPVQRGLVPKPEEWLWSSFRHYAYGEPGPVLVNETQKAELHIRKIS